jgi:hypothetical protein
LTNVVFDRCDHFPALELTLIPDARHTIHAHVDRITSLRILVRRFGHIVLTRFIAARSQALRRRAVDDHLPSQQKVVLGVEQELDTIVRGMEGAVNVARAAVSTKQEIAVWSRAGQIPHCWRALALSGFAMACLTVEYVDSMTMHRMICSHLYCTNPNAPEAMRRQGLGLQSHRCRFRVTHSQRKMASEASEIPCGDDDDACDRDHGRVRGVDGDDDPLQPIESCAPRDRHERVLQPIHR